jgi:hypothetical protein
MGGPRHLASAGHENTRLSRVGSLGKDRHESQPASEDFESGGVSWSRSITARHARIRTRACPQMKPATKFVAQKRILL